MGHREAFATVSLAWLLAALLGALPYAFLGLSPLDAVFESMSGFTTAGATILSEYNSQGYWILSKDLVQSSLAYHWRIEPQVICSIAHPQIQFVFNSA